MAEQVVYTFTINTSLDTFIAGDIITVVIEDTTNVVSVKRNGGLITSGEDLSASDYEAGFFQFSYVPFRYCSGTNLVTVGAFVNQRTRRGPKIWVDNRKRLDPLDTEWAPVFPYYQILVSRDDIACTDSVSNIEKYGPPVLVASSTPTAQDGQVTVKVRSANAVKFYYKDFAYSQGGFAPDSSLVLDDGDVVFTYTFLNLNSGPRILYARDQLGGLVTWSIDLPFDKLSTYNLKYRGWFQAITQGFANGETWRVDLKFRGYSDASSEISGFSGDPLTIDFGIGKVGLDKFEDLICGTIITLNLFSNTREQWLTDFGNVDEKNVLIEVYRGSTLMYSGFNIVEQYSEPWADTPYFVSVRFSDGLSDLKNYEYVLNRRIKDVKNPSETSLEEQMITGKSSFLQILSFCLNKLELGYGIRSCLNVYASGMDSGNSDDPLDQMFVDNSIFYNDTSNEPFDLEQVLNILLASYPTRAKLSSDGSYYYILPIEVTGAVDYRQYDRYGAYEASGSLDPIINTTAADASGIYIKEATLFMGKTFQLIQIVKEARLRDSLIPLWNNQTKINDITRRTDIFQGWNGALRGDNITWQSNKIDNEYELIFRGVDGKGCDAYISTTGIIEYQSSDKFSLSFDVFFDPTKEIDPLAQSSDPGWVPIRWLFKVGDYYYNQNGTWSTTFTINEHFLFSYRSYTNILYQDNFRPDISKTESSFEFRIYDTDLKYNQQQSSTGNGTLSDSWPEVASDMAAISLTGLRDGSRYIYQIDYGGGVYINCYYVLRQANGSDDGINVITSSGNSAFKWFLEKTLPINITEQDESFFKVKSPRLTVLPNGLTNPEVDLYEKRISDGNVRIKEFELPIFGVPININNAKRSYKNIWIDASGTAITSWDTSGFSIDEIQMEIFSRHYKAPLNRLSVQRGFVKANVFGYSFIRDTSDDNRVYLVDSLTLSVKYQQFSGELVEVRADTLVNTSAFNSDFNSDFLTT